MSSMMSLICFRSKGVPWLSWGVDQVSVRTEVSVQKKTRELAISEFPHTARTGKPGWPEKRENRPKTRKNARKTGKNGPKTSKGGMTQNRVF
jgi:hypothetical protein